MSKSTQDRQNRKPRPIRVANLHARAIRGPREAGVWYWRAESYIGTKDGQGTTIWTGWETPEAAARHLARLVAAGNGAAPQPKATDKIVCVGDLLEAWVSHCQTRLSSSRKQIKPRTLEVYTKNATIIAKLIGKQRLTTVDSDTTEAFWRDQLAAGYGERTVSVQLTTLCAAWSWGRTKGLTPEHKLSSPATTKLKDTRDNGYVPSVQDWWLIVDQLTGWPQMMARILEATGCRPGEASPMEWTDLDVDRRELKIRISKTGPRTVPVPQSLIDYLHGCTPEDKRAGRILAPASEMSCRTSFRRFLETACETLGIKYFPPKAIRHLTVDRLYRSGADIATIAAILGHSAEMAIKTYRKVNGDDRQRALALAGLGERPETKPQVVPLRRNQPQPA